MVTTIPLTKCAMPELLRLSFPLDSIDDQPATTGVAPRMNF
jgi:hypothetical protein